ncbi:MAG: uracil-DNA glycosylase [Candidatus Krumholzibacteriaceae bacterium]|jgi:DNA polymerase
MNQNDLGAIRRYLLARQGSGMDVAYRVAGDAGVAIPVATGAADASGAVEATAPSAAPRRSDRDIVMLTSPVVERKPGIRVTREAQPAEQSSLFGEPVKKPGLDLSEYDLPKLDELVSQCARCRLAEGRTRTVFGSGSPHAKIIFIGEAPGREEDLQGLPFVGRAGQLLTKMLAAIGFSRDEVYIANILKCRPPINREPQEDEMAACEPYLLRQLELINPVIICALGRIAAHGLLKKPTALSILRQGVHYYNDVPLAVVYHPAALLRNPNLKRDAWEDLKMVRKLYDEAIGEGA